MATSLYLTFRPLGVGASRSVQSLIGLKTPEGFHSLFQVDFTAASFLATDQALWTFKARGEEALAQSEEFPADELEEALRKTLDPLDAVLAMRELEERWHSFVTELAAFMAARQVAGEDTSIFYPSREFSAFAKERSGEVEWS